ncbi:LamG domain-containing protein [Fibrobacterota bacterium]
MPAPAPEGVFDNTLSPVVEVCELDAAGCATVVQFTTTPAEGAEYVRLSDEDESYIVNWHTDLYDLDALNTYRIKVMAEGQELGYADVDVVNSGKDLRHVDTQQYIALKDGRTLPIKFRIEQGALQVPEPGGLFAYYPFNGNANDESGNDNNGTVHGNAVLTADRFGNPNSAYLFDGVDDYIDCGNDASINMTTNFTVSVWVKFHTYGDDKTILSNGSGPFYQNWHIHRHSTPSDKLYIGIYGDLQLNFLPTTQTGIWYNLAFSIEDIDGTNAKVTTYLNGQQVASVTAMAPTDVSGDNLYIGRFTTCQYPYTYAFNGVIDDVSVYNYVLTDAEIADLSN